MTGERAVPFSFVVTGRRRGTLASTLLQLDAADRAVERGNRQLNLPTGPTVAMLRSCEHVEHHLEFIIISGPRPLWREIAIRRAASAVARGESAWHRTSTRLGLVLPRRPRCMFSS